MGSQKVVHWEERRDAVGSRAERAHPPRAPGREFRTRSRSRREAGPCAPARECAGVVRGSIRPVGACARRHFLQPPACVAVPVGSRARPPREMAPPGATGLGGAPPRPLLAPAARGRAKTTLGPAGHLGPPWAPASLPRPRPPPAALGLTQAPEHAPTSGRRGEWVPARRRAGAAVGGGVPWPEAVWQRARCWGSLPAGRWRSVGAGRPAEPWTCCKVGELGPPPL